MFAWTCLCFWRFPPVNIVFVVLLFLQHWACFIIRWDFIGQMCLTQKVLLWHLNLNGWGTKLQADEGKQNSNTLLLQKTGDSLVLLLFKPYVSLCDDKIMNNIMYLIVNPKVSALALIRFHMLGCKRIHQHVQSVPVRFYKNFGRLLNDHGILSTQPTVFCFQSMKWILFFKH